MSFASYITISRIILIPPIIYLSSSGEEFLSFLLFVTAGVTDYFDGYIARKTNTVTSLGALLDLLADKLLVCIVLVWCALLSSSILIILPTLIIISRELIISSVRQFLVENRGDNPIKVTYIAKSKTTIQIIATSFLILCPQMNEMFNQITLILIWLATSISIYTLLIYLKEYKAYF